MCTPPSSPAGVASFFLLTTVSVFWNPLNKLLLLVPARPPPPPTAPIAKTSLTPSAPPKSPESGGSPAEGVTDAEKLELSFPLCNADVVEDDADIVSVPKRPRRAIPG